MTSIHNACQSMDTGAILRHLATGLKDMRLRISLDSSKDLCLSDLNDVIALLFFAKEAYGPFAWHLRKINGFVRGVFYSSERSPP